MFHEIPKATRKNLREFGFVFGIGLILIFGLLLPWLRGHGSPKAIWIVSAISMTLGAIAPATLRPAYYLWMRIGAVLGWINSKIILGLVFYIIVTPMGLVFKLLKKDPLTRKLNAEATTYRTTSEQRQPVTMENPY